MECIKTQAEIAMQHQGCNMHTSIVSLIISHVNIEEKKFRRSFTCDISFALSTTINKSVPNHGAKKHFSKKNKNMQCCRAFASMWRFQSVSTFWRVSKRFKVPGIASNTLRNKSVLVVAICATSLAFKLFSRENVAFWKGDCFAYKATITC